MSVNNQTERRYRHCVTERDEHLASSSTSLTLSCPSRRNLGFHLHRRDHFLHWDLLLYLHVPLIRRHHCSIDLPLFTLTICSVRALLCYHHVFSCKYARILPPVYAVRQRCKGIPSPSWTTALTVRSIVDEITTRSVHPLTLQVWNIRWDVAWHSRNVQNTIHCWQMQTSENLTQVTSQRHWKNSKLNRSRALSSGLLGFWCN